MSKTKPQTYLADATEQLLLAAADGDAAGVRASLSAGAYVNASNYNKQTPLIRAAFFGHYDVVRLLLAAAADTQAKDKVGLTAFDWSIARGFPEIAQLLRAAAAAAEPQIAPGKEAAPQGEPPSALTTSLPSTESERVIESERVAEPVTELAAGPSAQSKPGESDEVAAESTLDESPSPELIEPATQPVYAAESIWYSPELIEPTTRPVREVAAESTLDESSSHELIEPGTQPVNEITAESTLYESPSPELIEPATEPVSEVAAESSLYESLSPELIEPATEPVSEVPAESSLYESPSPELIEPATEPVSEVPAELSLYETPSPELIEPAIQPVDGPAAPTIFGAAAESLEGDEAKPSAIASEQVTEPVAQARLDESPTRLLGDAATQLLSEPAAQAQFNGEASAASTPRLSKVSEQSSAYSSASLLQAPAIPKPSQTNANMVGITGTGRPAVHLGPAVQKGNSVLWSLLAVFVLAGITVTYLTIRQRPAEAPAQTTIANEPKVAPAALKNSPTVQGEIKGSEISLPEPEYPAAAEKQGLTGSIGVAVTVNSKGKVVVLRTSNGHWQLRNAARAAALKAVFKPQEGARRSGTITYSFAGINSQPAANTTVTNQPQPVEAAEVKTFVEGDLKGSEISLPRPAYPASAKGKVISGSITVAVVVNNKGRVVRARSSQGASLLRNAARNAALKATFKPREGARRSGTITYDFPKAKLNQS